MQTYDAVGRRKNAVARVRIAPGTGKRIINKVQMKKYLQRETLEMVVEQPLQELGMSENFDVYVNVSGGGILKHAPNKAAAQKFLEYLASDSAQRYFADGNNEWPVVTSVKIDNPALNRLGKFKADTLPVNSLAMYQAKAQMIFDRNGFR